ncbi:hypothetical protein HanRHA438_Chr15g0725811 [Helianthus annuus]|nr:hypothetical protein HanXRQr2_Chr15g0713471 [Helianthus annuus]KAJ0452694.1 hypothetical protein HanHA300_Chr15g0581851 [Helianthus annuus]KAJ0457669.1 hypothetical protein HanIR_Chr15g0776351 [Helianthus annuus]KAJ0474606.1 hypothetical protein HanHA89_Chr15g0631621 [Helianthus annuus]KAJ0650163.1 hypothetical protein HanLR1_Chr15g0592541 [Helianthus annuus]
MVASIQRLHRISRDNVALKAISLFHFFYLCYYYFIDPHMLPAGFRLDNMFLSGTRKLLVHLCFKFLC